MEYVSPENFLTESDKEELAENGFAVYNILGHTSCSITYQCDYTNQESSTSEPQKLVCKVMESVNAPKDFAMKFLPRELAIVERIRSAGCPYVHHVHSAVQINTKVMLFTRFTELGNLADYIEINWDFMNELQVKTWFHQLAVALAHLHSIHVVHRNIKCENILLMSDSTVALSDFGFSRLSICSKEKQIYSNTFCGSFNYAAPEIIRGIPYRPKSADVWSLGVVLFTMLNGQMPFPQSNLRKLYKAQTKMEFNFKRSVLSRTSNAATSLVERMLEPWWMTRIPSAQILKSSWFTGLQPSFSIPPAFNMIYMEDFFLSLKRYINEKKSSRQMITLIAEEN